MVAAPPNTVPAFHQANVDNPQHSPDNDFPADNENVDLDCIHTMVSLLDDVEHTLLDLHDDQCVSNPLPCSCCNLPMGSCKTFIASTLEVVFQLRASGKPNQDGLQIPLCVSNLKHSSWINLLSGYFDCQPISSAILYGWDLSLVGNPTPRDAKFNHPSAIKFWSDTQEYIDKELAHGCLLGPLVNPPFDIACADTVTNNALDYCY